MQVNKDVEIKAVKFATGLVIAIAVFCAWLSNTLTKDYEK